MPRMVILIVLTLSAPNVIGVSALAVTAVTSGKTSPLLKGLEIASKPLGMLIKLAR